MQPYSYRDSGIEWLGKIPTHWKVDRLRDQAVINDEALGTNTPVDYEIRYLDISNVNSQGIVDHDEIRPLAFADAPSRARRKVKKFDTVISSVRTNLQAVAHIDFDMENLVASTGFFVCRPKFLALVQPKYLYFFLLTEYSKEYFFSRSIGISYPAIDDYDFGSIHMPVPPIEEQRAIAGFLDEACGKIDAAIQVKREQVAMLDVMAKAILNKAVLEGLNPTVPKQTINNIWFKTLPAHWQLRRLKDVSTMQTGVTLGKDYDGETDERPYLRVANVQDGHLALDDVKTIKLPPNLIRRYELQDGDVLMNEGGDLDKLGRGHVWHNEIPGCLHQNHVFALRCFPHKLLPDYLTLLTSSTHGRAYFEIMGKKTTNLASINSTKVNLFPVPLPPVTEQAEIVQWVQHERGKLKQAQDAVNEQIAVLEAYKKSLVHECVTGKKQVWLKVSSA
ncbi:restriction endonuclease subunit S [Thiothrix subterranea]|uniref:Restriction endonuclease subunit S n=1 Tax=Thiothrix subterranea TaxID=2735563 RepID=A0AA51MNH3_9GAMM|nr:restriction endonuclease subunit S [Thiothrix subterranea]MDQ5769469.1 restriction endonuclease subunit S [Thiothrix subterranea]WML86321.1 restriction endonuclease subunit S [Thiothrix subterranea]